MPDKPVLLLVDDQPENLDVLVSYLADSGLELVVATSGEQALQLATTLNPELVLLDVMMPGMDGFETCRQLKLLPGLQDQLVIFMSALADTGSKVKGFDAGAIDYISKPLQREEVLARIQAHLTIRAQQRELLQKNQQLEILNRDLQEQIQQRQQVERALHLADEKLTVLNRQEAERWGIDAFIGRSRPTLKLLQEVRNLRQAPRTNVLVLGESGTGKELISRAIHFGSVRSTRPFIAVNCSAIPAELADAEFFGHVKGAFTGATSDRAGYFIQADGGTLFLDEIGDMSLALQAKLLRVLEDGLVTPIGGKSQRRVDVRVVAATNADLVSRVQRKDFRQELYFRLAAYQLSIPPLRERVSDIPLLVEYYLSVLGRQMGRDSTAISSEALAVLNRYHYPGNVRELKNLIEYALIASRGETIAVEHLRFYEHPRGELPAATDRTSEVLSAVIAAADPPESPAERPSIPNECEHPEQRILTYVRDHGRIDNTVARRLLRVDHARASYLLKKLHREGLLARQGERRWSFYTER